jgi:carboxyl-terminal processing protease
VKKKRMMVGTTLVFMVAGVMLWGPTLWAEAQNVNMQLTKLNYVLRMVRDNYVEEPDAVKLLDGAIRGMLEELDPHSVYIEADEQKKVTEQFRGKFEGIGITFSIQNKWLTVVSPIPGTPSDRLGIRAGDRITHINSVSAYGISNEQVFDKLRGPKGTTVDVTVARPGLDKPLDFTIIRDTIPIFSVGSSFLMPDNKTGYIRINQFTATTDQEVASALDSLKRQGMTQLLLDLRSNPGGYLDQAWKVADLFLPKKDQMIVYTLGRTERSNQEFKTTGRGKDDGFPLVVLINHGSASASEIVAGAIQDHDRGLVVGQVSFGKGLVQTPYQLMDGSVVRITTARYYTPAGRLIQRPYDKGIAEYIMEGRDEEDPNAEIVDTTKREEFHTDGGRVVYGGGGVSPDVTVKPERTTVLTARLFSQRLYFEYATEYAGKHSQLSSNFRQFLTDFKVTDDMLEGLKELAKSRKIEWSDEEWQKDIEFTKNTLKSELASALFNDRNLYSLVMIQNDVQVQKALTLFDEARDIAAGIMPDLKSR